jgi:spore germination protein (amino acid permease)
MGFITFITQTGVGIIMLPSEIAETSGHDGWIPVLLTGLLIALVCGILVALLRRYSNKAIYDINRFLFGKMVGTFFNALLVLYLLTAAVMGSALFAYFIRITLLDETPQWALAPFIILPSFYLVWYGLKYVSRFLYITVYFYIPILILVIILLKEARISFLLPVGEAGVEGVLAGFQNSFFAFLGFELIVFFYPYITDREKAMKSQLLAVLASTLFFLVMVVASVAVFGENFLRVLILPFFNMSRIYNAPILERVDLYITAFWFMPLACSVRAYIFAAFDGLNKVFKVKKTKWIYVSFFVVLLVLSSLLESINQLFAVIDATGYVGAGIIVFLILCFFLSFIRKKGVA